MPDNAWKILLRVSRILERKGIPFWLESGTLLGLYRDRTLLPHASNVNLGVRAESLPALPALRWALWPRYRVRIGYDVSGREWIDGNVVNVQILPTFRKGGYAGTVVITPRFVRAGLARWIDDRTCKQTSATHIARRVGLSVGGHTFDIPSDVEQYLAERYGDWRQVRTEWDTNRDDGSIIPPALWSTLKRKTKWTRPERFLLGMKLVGRNLRRARRLLADTIGILEKNHIRYWLDEGTLLGIIRDGELIPWDHDMDIAVDGDDAEKLLAIRRQFSPRYRFRPHRDCSGRIPTGALRAARVKFHLGNLWLLVGREPLKLDIFFKYRIDDAYHWIDSYTHKRVDRHFYDTLDTVTYDNRPYKTPSDIDAYLARRFGNWRVPDSTYDSSLDDPSCVD